MQVYMISELQVFSQGEKIKNLRYQLDITQNELANEKLSQQVISKLENDKMLLSYNYARLLIEKIQQISEQKGIELNFNNTIQYWMESKKFQADNILKSYLSEIEKYENKPIDEEFNELIFHIENICIDYDVSDELKYISNKKIYKLYHFHYKWKEGNQYLLQCYGIAYYNRNNEELPELLYDLIRAYLNLGDYEEAINYEQQVKLTLKNVNNSDYEKKLYFYLALAYSYSSKFEKALNLLGKIKSKNFSLTKREQLTVEIEEANCYKELKKNEEAVKKYSSIISNKTYLSFYKDISTIYRNLLEIEFERENSEKIEEYFNALNLLV